MTWMFAAEEGGSNVLRIPLFEFFIGLAAFFIVFGVLAKFALPVIKKTLEDRARMRSKAGSSVPKRRRPRLNAPGGVPGADGRCPCRGRGDPQAQTEAERAGVMEEARKAAEVQAAQIAANATSQIEAEKAKALAESASSPWAVSPPTSLGRIVGESMTDDARAAEWSTASSPNSNKRQAERRAELMIGASRTSMAALREAVNALRRRRGVWPWPPTVESCWRSRRCSAGSARCGRPWPTRRWCRCETGCSAACSREGRAAALDLIAETVDLRWSTDRDMVDGHGRGRCRALLMSAEKEGRLDWVEGGDLPLRPDRSSPTRTCRWP